MPEEPGRDRLAAAWLKRRRSGRPRRRFREKDPIPWDADVIEPHLCIEFVESAAQGRDKWILVPDRHLAADHNAGVRLFDQTHRSSLVGVLAHPIPDRCCTPGESEEAASVSYPVPILRRRRDMLR